MKLWVKLKKYKSILYQLTYQSDDGKNKDIDKGLLADDLTPRRVSSFGDYARPCSSLSHFYALKLEGSMS